MATADIDNVVNELIAEALGPVLVRLHEMDNILTELSSSAVSLNIRVSALEATLLDFGKTITLTVTAVE